MDFWKNHKLTILLNEAPKPILLVWFFIKDLIKHIFKLFSLSWLGSRKAFNKNVIIPSCIAAFFTILLFSLSSFIMSKFNMSRNAADTMFFMVIILNLLSVAWGFSTVSSVVLAKDENKIPVVALCEKNRPGFWIMVHSNDLVKIKKDK